MRYFLLADLAKTFMSEEENKVEDTEAVIPEVVVPTEEDVDTESAEEGDEEEV